LQDVEKWGEATTYFTQLIMGYAMTSHDSNATFPFSNIFTAA